MSNDHQSYSQPRRHWMTGASALTLTWLLLSAASAEPDAGLLGASKKSVHRILGDGEALVGGLFNEESSASHSGGIGSTHAFRTRIGYLGGRSCYAFFMKKSGERLNPIEIFGLLYLCANRAEWSELEIESRTVGLIYRASSSKGKGAGQTYLATLDETKCKLFVYSPQWRPDFDRELWITPDEAPVHREVDSLPSKGELPRPSRSKQAILPDPSLFGKSARPSNAKQVIPDQKRVRSDAKQGVYLPKLDQVVPDEPKSAKRVKRQRQKKRTTSPPPTIGK